MKTVNIYTDGACSGNQSDENLGGWGAVLEYGQHTKRIFGAEKNTTNNRMEMMALIEALQAMKEKDLMLNIFSDSAYLINCFTKKWYLNWKRNGWMTSSKKPVENKDLWIRLLGLIEEYPFIRFHRIKGHLNPAKKDMLDKWYEKFKSWNGNDFTYESYLHVVEMNNEADALANKGVDSIRE